MKKNTNNNKRPKYPKLPKDFGSIVYLGDNRNKPYGARKLVGYNNNASPLYKYIDYGATWWEAYDILKQYNSNPYDLDYNNMVLDEIYNILEPILKKEVDDGLMSKSNYTNLKSAYTHLKQIQKVKVLEIKKRDINNIINTSGLGFTSRNYIKNIFCRLMVYAKDQLDLPIDISICDLKVGKKEKSNKHYPFTDDLVKQIYLESKKDNTAKLVLIYLFTTMRPNELLNIENKNVFLDSNYMIGGSKTEAGKNRIIPIHPIIKPIIEELFNPENKYLVINNNTKTKMTYDSYQKRFDMLMKKLNIDNHTPYDTRHTFATKCDEVGIDKTIIKILMGHSLGNDVTYDVYIHISEEKLIREVEKIKYWE